MKPTRQGSRAGTEVTHDEGWKEQVRKNQGIVLSIDGIQPDKGNETIYLLREVLTGRILHADHVTERTKDRLKQLLAPVVALEVPGIGVSRSLRSMLQREREPSISMDGSPVGYAGLQMQEALTHIQTSLEKLEKRGEV